jgi:hypothetical protein
MESLLSQIHKIGFTAFLFLFIFAQKAEGSDIGKSYDFSQFKSETHNQFKKYFESQFLMKNKHKEITKQSSLRLDQLKVMNRDFMLENRKHQINKNINWPTDLQIIKKYSHQIIQRN